MLIEYFVNILQQLHCPASWLIIHWIKERLFRNKLDKCKIIIHLVVLFSHNGERSIAIDGAALCIGCSLANQEYTLETIQIYRIIFLWQHLVALSTSKTNRAQKI